MIIYVGNFFNFLASLWLLASGVFSKCFIVEICKGNRNKLLCNFLLIFLGGQISIPDKNGKVYISCWLRNNLLSQSRLEEKRTIILIYELWSSPCIIFAHCWMYYFCFTEIVTSQIYFEGSSLLSIMM